MILAVLWDNDGVLVDTEALFFETTRASFAEIGLHLTRDLWARRYLAEGWSSSQIAKFLGAAEERTAPMLEARNRTYRELLRKAPPLRAQVRETLTRLHGRIRMGIVTGCSRDLFQIAHAASGLLKFFESVVTADDCAHPKPHPDLYLAGLKALGVPADACLAVEDSPRGLAAARAAGVPCVVVPTELTRGLDFPGALSVEPDASGVLRYIPGHGSTGTASQIATMDR